MKKFTVRGRVKEPSSSDSILLSLIQMFADEIPVEYAASKVEFESTRAGIVITAEVDGQVVRSLRYDHATGNISLSEQANFDSRNKSTHLLRLFRRFLRGGYREMVDHAIADLDQDVADMAAIGLSKWQSDRVVLWQSVRTIAAMALSEIRSALPARKR